MGIEAAALSPANVQSMSGAGAQWTRRNGLLWSSVEPVEGAREWGAVAGLEQELQTAAKRGLNVILIVRSTPDWAQQRPGVACGAVRADKMAALGVFMRDVVARYSKPPFNVRYFELWNEPDVDPSLVVPDNIYGCWGDQSDPFYGGGVYAEALKAVYPQVKAANPRAQLLIGGLLLDCNPDQPPAGKNCQSSRFLEGILIAGGGASFDMVSFHAYDFYQGGTSYANSNWSSDWITTGPVVAAKARFIRDVLQRYGVSGKPLLNTEAGLLCWGCDAPPPEFETTKVNYVPQTYALAKAEGLAANLWYSLEGWIGTNLLDASGQPTAAYNAFKTAAANLGRANFVRQRDDAGEGIRAYEFIRGGRRLWVVWSADGQPRQVGLPTAPVRVLDPVGQALPRPQGQLTVDAQPLYIEWSR